MIFTLNIQHSFLLNSINRVLHVVGMTFVSWEVETDLFSTVLTKACLQQSLRYLSTALYFMGMQNGTKL